MRVVTPAPRATVWLPALAVLVFLSLYIPVAGRLLSDMVAAQPTSVSPPSRTAPAAGTTVATVAATITPSVQSSTPIPACTPLATPNPGGIDLSTTAPGLHVRYDPSVYYQIYGNTANQLRTQIAHCAPGATSSSEAEYTGDTSYNLDWQYTTLVSNNGCTITNVQIGLHIVTTLPAWSPTAQAAAGLPNRWQAFANALAAHEHGHAQLDANYAGALLQRLNSLGNIDCSNITGTVQSVVDSGVHALNSANDAYDQQTNHGATQGAILPTY